MAALHLPPDTFSANARAEKGSYGLPFATGISITPRNRHFAAKDLSGNKRVFLFFNSYIRHRVSQHQHMGDIQ